MPGGWEEHTKGVGSKLMLAMGWQAGAGLGRAGGGRVDPVEARIYPQVFPDNTHSPVYILGEFPNSNLKRKSS